MAVRIPIKIFRLQQTQSGIFDLAPTRFVEGGITTNFITTDADGTEYIDLGQTPVNQPLATTVLSRVYADKFGKYVILDGAEKLYIRSNTTDQSVLPYVFEFYVNPQRLSPTYRKLVNETRTRGGWEIQHWGDALTELRIEGKSGGMHRRGSAPRILHDTSVADLEQRSAIQQQESGDGLRAGQSIMDSLAWQRLLQLKQLYDVDHAVRNQEQTTLLGIAVYDSFYVGYFTDFSGPNQDANEPYQFSYNFAMKILYETTVSAFNPVVKASVTAGSTSDVTNITNLNQ